jgi:hypothetical protein
MEIDEYGRVDDERRRPRHPDDSGETQGARKPTGEHAAPSGDEEKDRCDRDAAQERDHRRKRVAAVVFGTPRVWRQSLEPMENKTHPEPAGEDCEDSGEGAGSEGELQRFHNAEVDAEISARPLSLSRSEFAQGVATCSVSQSDSLI